MNKIVARYLDGRILKGQTNDFFPGKPTFHVNVLDAPPGTKPVEVQLKDLKAVFFVKDFTGFPAHHPRQEFNTARPPAGRRIKVAFKDNEVIVGTTQAYQPDRPGFFLVPADPLSNNERCYVVREATQQIEIL
jgi:hypothetical protein